MSILVNRANIAFLINIFLVLFLKTDQEVESPVAYLAVLVFAEVLFFILIHKRQKKKCDRHCIYYIPVLRNKGKCL